MASFHLSLSLCMISPASDNFYADFLANQVHFLFELSAVFALENFWWTVLPVYPVQLLRNTFRSSARIHKNREKTSCSVGM